MIRLLAFFAVFALISCESTELPKTQDAGKSVTLKSVNFNNLPHWPRVSPQSLVAFDKSCKRILKRGENTSFGKLDQAGTYGDWQDACAALPSVDRTNGQAMARFFETYFTPYQVLNGNDSTGLFTGYYEASLNGSRVKTDQFNIPLHLRPDDLVMVQLGEFRDDLKGRRIAGRVIDGKLKPYETREDIVDGQWPHNNEVLIWVDSAVDAFFVQIQGSGIVTMQDGSTMRIGYAGQNGHPYYAIGRELIKRGALTKDKVSMQSIRSWLEGNPRQAAQVMNTNKSYVFFRELKGEGPIGGEGIALTAGHSLAIDRSLLPYGAPMWVNIDYPDNKTPIHRLMIAQDTGGAIRGPVRGDVFWGYGERAEYHAGQMKADGQYWIFLPK